MRIPDKLYERVDNVRSGYLDAYGMSFQSYPDEFFDAVFLPPVDETLRPYFCSLETARQRAALDDSYCVEREEKPMSRVH